MEFKAAQIAGLLGGVVEGNPETVVRKLSKIEEGESGSVSFLANPQYNHYLYTTDASVVIIGNDLVLEKPVKPTCTIIRVSDPRGSFALLLEAYNKMKVNVLTGIDKSASVPVSAKVGKGVFIGALVSIGENADIADDVKIFPGTVVGENAKVGSRTILHSGVRIYHDVQIGNDCTIHAGAVIGGDGFGFAPNAENNYKKVPHIGNVIIDDFVEIGANTTIDRATIGSTVIRKGVKLDNLIQIAHNVEIGENTVIAAQTGIAGSVKIGKNCMIGGQVGIVGHITIADNVKIAAQSGIGKSITTSGMIVQGSPAYEIGDYKRSYVMFMKLPDLNKKIKELESVLSELKQMVK